MPRPFDADRATAYLWQALRSLATVEAPRGLLGPGRVKIAAVVDACVEERPIVVVVAGELVVELDGTVLFERTVVQ